MLQVVSCDQLRTPQVVGYIPPNVVLGMAFFYGGGIQARRNTHKAPTKPRPLQANFHRYLPACGKWRKETRLAQPRAWSENSVDYLQRPWSRCVVQICVLWWILDELRISGDAYDGCPGGVHVVRTSTIVHVCGRKSRSPCCFFGVPCAVRMTCTMHWVCTLQCGRFSHG